MLKPLILPEFSRKGNFTAETAERNKIIQNSAYSASSAVRSYAARRRCRATLAPFFPSAVRALGQMRDGAFFARRSCRLFNIAACRCSLSCARHQIS
jgi:hypothetical protein